MKKTTTFLLGLLLLLALTACSSFGERSDSGSPANDSAQVIQLPYSGVTLTVPDSLKELMGTFDCYDGGEIGYGTGIVYCELSYYAMPREEFTELMTKETLTEEDRDRLLAACCTIGYVFGINDNRGVEELTSFLADYDIAADGMEGIGAAEDYTFFYLPIANEENAGDAGEYAREICMLLTAKDELVAGMSFSEPVSFYAVADEGAKINFDTVDLDGNPVTMADIFAAHDVTMINVWATWCGPCVNEMPELAEQNRAFAGKGGAIVGVLLDDTDEETLADAKDILDNAGADFLVVVAPGNFEDIIPIQAFPTSYFVSSDGTIIGDPIIGANPAAYASKMEEALAFVKEN